MRSAAVVALRHPKLRTVTAADHTQVLRLLADRHNQLIRARTQAVNRLHDRIAEMLEGGLPRGLSADKAAKAMRGIRPSSALDTERKRLAAEVLVDVRRLDAQLKDLRSRIVAAVEVSGTTVTAVDGVGPIVAAIICGRVGNIGRFPSAGHFARYNGTAPIEASSGPRVRHRLNRRGDRHLNHALHVAVIAQLSRDTAGRAYFERKLAEGKSKKEALRSFKRRISDAVYRQLVLDARC